MIKKTIRFLFTTVGNIFGYEVSFARKVNNDSRVMVDRNLWERYLNPGPKIELYYNGLNRANVAWSDNFSKQCRFYSLQELVDLVLDKKITGHFVECGCWKGHSAYILGTLLSKSGSDRRLYIFDAFEGGLSEKSQEDENISTKLTEEEVAQESDVFKSTEEEVAAVLSDFPFVSIYKGWIPDRFHEVSEEQFALVHIDVDLYEPTRDSLAFFYPRLAEGGCIVVDDYGLAQFPGAKRAVDEFLDSNACHMFYEVPMGGCFILK
jgi:O-methyltransferase